MRDITRMVKGMGLEEVSGLVENTTLENGKMTKLIHAHQCAIEYSFWLF